MTKLIANWSAPDHISALTTSCAQGNMGLHVGDDPDRVINNRKKLRQELNLPNEPEWLEQTHSIDCIIVENERSRQADAAITRDPKRVLAIMTADCLPILLCNRQGSEIAAIHAGWKGLANGIIQQTIEKLQSNPHDLIAWIGPAICAGCFEVGNDVKDIFQQRYASIDSFFKKHQDKWLANLAGIAEKVLQELGVQQVFQSNVCTFEGESDFYSYRRESQTGRIASLIWFNN